MRLPKIMPAIPSSRFQPALQQQIWNSIGVCIYKNTFVCTSGFCNINLDNNIPGIYMVRITDSQGKVYTQKFVIGH